MDEFAIFLVSRSSDGEREWFSARDAAAGVSIPAESRDDAYALVSSLNRAFSHHLRIALSGAETREREVRAKALEEAALRVDAKANGYQVEARDVRRSERDRRFCASVADRLCGAAADIRALQSEER